MRGDTSERIGIAIGRLPSETRQCCSKIHRVLPAAARYLEHGPARWQDPAQDGEDRVAVAGHRGRILRDIDETTGHQVALYQSRPQSSARSPSIAAVCAFEGFRATDSGS